MRRRNAGQTSSESYLSASHTLASESALRLGGIKKTQLGELVIATGADSLKQGTRAPGRTERQTGKTFSVQGL